MPLRLFPFACCPALQRVVLVRRSHAVSNPFFSIVVPVYDRVQLLREAVRSALAQTYPHLEVILVTDGSPPETMGVVRSFSNDPRVRVFEYGDNSGNACRGRNRGILEARGDWVSFLDSDDLYEPDRLTRQASAIADDPNVDLVSGLARYIVDGSRKIPGLEDGYVNHAIQVSVPILLRANPFVTSTVSVRRDVLFRHGGFRASMRYREDHELWLRLAHRGCRMVLAPHVLCLYRVHSGNAELLFKERDEHWRELMLEQYTRPFEAWQV